MGMKEVSVSIPAVSRRRSEGTPAQHHLVYHEFSVVFPDRAGGSFEARIWQICRTRPFPAQAPMEFTACRFPFRFRRQARTLPFGEGRGFVK